MPRETRCTAGGRCRRQVWRRKTSRGAEDTSGGGRHIGRRKMHRKAEDASEGGGGVGRRRRRWKQKQSSRWKGVVPLIPTTRACSFSIRLRLRFREAVSRGSSQGLSENHQLPPQPPHHQPFSTTTTSRRQSPPPSTTTVDYYINQQQQQQWKLERTRYARIFVY